MRLGEYEVLGELGRGGSARVYRVRGPEGEVVAAKLLSGKAGHEHYARFAREKRLLESLGEAEGFVPLLAAGVSERGPFFVMPLLEGGTLRARLVKGPLECEETLQLARTLAAAIGWAHEQGIVHRDLKPENILFTKDGRPLIADLGIAKHFVDASRSESITGERAFLGTPVYMAPEQMNCSKSVDARADVFGLGALLYECLTGTTPFTGETLPQLVDRTEKGDYKRVRDVREDTPLDLAHAIDIALNQNPDFRYEDGFAFAHALGARVPQRARLQPTVQTPPRRRRRSPVLWAAPVLVLGAALLAGHQGPPSPRADAPALTTSTIVTTAPTAAPKINPSAPKGWAGEPLPAAVRPGAEQPVYIFDTRKGLELEVVYVPPGDFFMGAINGAQHEKPIHTHPMPRGYYLARTEVTWDQYRAFCQATGHALPAKPAWEITGSHPVVNVTWFDAAAFCEWAGLALPTEAEWERAARGTDERQWPWGDTWPEKPANVRDDSGADDGYLHTAPVGSFPLDISPAGALDMAGNVGELTADWFDPGVYIAYSNGLTAPPASGASKTFRGGGWKEDRFCATTTFRGQASPVKLSDCLGFRPCLRTTP